MIYSAPIKTLAACDGRYPSEQDEADVLAWAQSLPKRLQAANLLAQKEQELVREAVDEMRPLYPRYSPQHDRAWEKTTRDMELVLRYAVQGMMCDDPDMPNDKLYVWLGTLVRGLGHTQQIFRDCFNALIENCRATLPPDVFELAEPYLERMRDDMSAFPEPMKQTVN